MPLGTTNIRQGKHIIGSIINGLSEVEKKDEAFFSDSEIKVMHTQYKKDMKSKVAIMNCLVENMDKDLDDFIWDILEGLTELSPKEVLNWILDNIHASGGCEHCEGENIEIDWM